MVILSNGYKMPKIALGTYGLKKEETKEVVLNAINLGYRHIESAPIYLNEKEIAEAIKASNIDRDELFITSKIPPHIKNYDSTLKIAEKIMSNLGVDYLDALLINNPVPWGKEGEDFSKENLEVYRALETLYKEERVGAIGVSNFDISDLEKLLPYVTIKPHINQLGIFIGHTLDDLRAYCENHNIIILGHSPLARGRIFNIDLLNELSSHYGLSAAQLAIKYVYEKGVFPIVKASTLEHLKDNLNFNQPLQKGWDSPLDTFNKDVRDYKPPRAKSIL
ncbi:MAG: aldo/keto reductase family protein [Candidatus Izemoplasmataceae bacterium]